MTPGGPQLQHDWFPLPVPENVQLGDRAWLYSTQAFVNYASRRPCGVRIGDRSGVYYGSFFNLGPAGEVVIGRYSTVASLIVSSNGRVTIGDHVLISWDVVIADSPAAVPPQPSSDPEPAAGAEPTAETAAAEEVVVGELAWLGTRTVLLPGARIGRGAIVGAATVVDFAVPDYAVVAGAPARIVGWSHPETEQEARPAPRV